MQVMIEVTNPLAREQTMTKNEDRSKIVAIKELLERDEDFIRSAVQSFVQAALEAEIRRRLRLRRASGPRAGSAIAAAITKGL